MRGARHGFIEIGLETGTSLARALVSLCRRRRNAHVPRPYSGWHRFTSVVDCYSNIHQRSAIRSLADSMSYDDDDDDDDDDGYERTVV